MDGSLLFHEGLDATCLSNYDYSEQALDDNELDGSGVIDYAESYERRTSICSLGESLREEFMSIRMGTADLNSDNTAGEFNESAKRAVFSLHSSSMAVEKDAPVPETLRPGLAIGVWKSDRTLASAINDSAASQYQWSSFRLGKGKPALLLDEALEKEPVSILQTKSDGFKCMARRGKILDGDRKEREPVRKLQPKSSSFRFFNTCSPLGEECREKEVVRELPKKYSSFKFASRSKPPEDKSQECAKEPLRRGLPKKTASFKFLSRAKTLGDASQEQEPVQTLPRKTASFKLMTSRCRDNHCSKISGLDDVAPRKSVLRSSSFKARSQTSCLQ